MIIIWRLAKLEQVYSFFFYPRFNLGSIWERENNCDASRFGHQAYVIWRWMWQDVGSSRLKVATWNWCIAFRITWITSICESEDNFRIHERNQEVYSQIGFIFNTFLFYVIYLHTILVDLNYNWFVEINP